jgi:hypothetical protein
LQETSVAVITAFPCEKSTCRIPFFVSGCEDGASNQQSTQVRQPSYLIFTASRRDFAEAARTSVQCSGLFIFFDSTPGNQALLGWDKNEFGAS